MNRNKVMIGLVLLVSLTLLIPGITQPMMTLRADLHRQSLVEEGKKIVQSQNLPPAMAIMAVNFLGSLKVEGESQVYERTQSILGAVQELWSYGYKLVSVLIITFSVIIPAIKSLLLLLALSIRRNGPILWWNAVISKWSMADVFAIGVLIASLAANTASGESALLFFDMELLPGFYWFVTYCLVAGVAGQWLPGQKNTVNPGQ